MNRKRIIGGIVVLLIVGGAAFWGGMAYAKSQTPARGSSGTTTFTRGAGATTGAGFAARGGTGGNATVGQVISQDSSGVTIKLANGNTQIVLIGSGVPILKQVNGSTSDLTAGTNIIVTGTANSDGSLTAQSVQLRPAGSIMPSTGASGTQTPTQ